jgi:hypothetical protein
VLTRFAAAAERVQEARIAGVLATYSPTPVSDPLTELAALAGKTRAWTAVAEERLGELDRLDVTTPGVGEQARALVGVFERALEANRRVLTDMVKLGTEERRVKISEQYSEQYSELLADFLRAVFADPELGTSAAQRRAAPQVIRRHLAEVNGTTGTDR